MFETANTIKLNKRKITRTRIPVNRSILKMQMLMWNNFNINTKKTENVTDTFHVPKVIRKAISEHTAEVY